MTDSYDLCHRLMFADITVYDDDEYKTNTTLGEYVVYKEDKEIIYQGEYDNWQRGL